MMTTMLTNMLMRYVTVGYQQYMSQKDTANLEKELNKEEKKETEKEGVESETKYSELESEVSHERVRIANPGMEGRDCKR